MLDGIAGYSFGQWMPYGGVGVAYAKSRTIASVVGLTDSDSATHTGLDLLVGTKYMFAKHWAVGFQYNHTEFNKKTHTYPVLVGGATGNFNSNMFAGTLDYRF